MQAAGSSIGSIGEGAESIIRADDLRGADPTKHIDVVLSAEGPSEILVGDIAVIAVRAELADEASSHEHALGATLDADEEKRILAIISVGRKAVQVKGRAVRHKSHPAPGEPGEVYSVTRNEMRSAIRVRSSTP